MITRTGDAGGITDRLTGANPTWVGLRWGLLYGPVTTGVLAAAVALPHAGDSAGTAVTRAWLLSGYAIALGVGVVIFGRVIDWWGVRTCLALGSAYMLIGAAVCLAGGSPSTLLAGRMVLAVGSAAVVPAVMSMSAGVDPADRGRVTAMVAAMMALWVAMAPLIGGVVTALAGWRAALVLPVLSVVMAPAVIRNGHGRARRREGRVDGFGALLLTVCAASILGVLHARLVTTTLVLTLAAIAACSGVWLWWWIRRRDDAVIPTGLVDALVLRVCVVAACVYAVLFGMSTVVAQALAGRGWAPMAAGAVLVPGAIAGAVLARQRRWNLDREIQLTVVLVVLAMVQISALVLGPVPPVLVAAAGGAFIAVSVGHLVIASLVNAVSPDARGGTAGLVYFAAFAGGAAGTAVVAASRDEAQALGSMALVSLIGAVNAVGGQRWQRHH
ncbi:MFS transporter [Micromonospora sp. WMMA1363]|uniref:MFS transporter n=1 Tax=Micromonospora sp. WMMA1363 TaxID=3053985 RepID=UPI00259CA53D|nr:MFS transporter [Micromonospora sp. WMMA1363]MDM4723308.1 MFS transporter [Micromonospora sp. WMMA1363]